MAASDKKPRVKKEVVAVCCLFLAVFIGCCLLSYHSADSSFNTAYSSPAGRVHNWGGLAGSYLADALFQLMGLTAFLIPLILLGLSLKMLFFAGAPVRYTTVLSLILLTVSLSALLSLTVADAGIRLASFRYELNGGGLAGKQLTNLSHTYLNTVGSILVFSLAGLVDGRLGPEQLSGPADQRVITHLAQPLLGGDGLGWGRPRLRVFVSNREFQANSLAGRLRQSFLEPRRLLRPL